MALEGLRHREIVDTLREFAIDPASVCDAVANILAVVMSIRDPGICSLSKHLMFFRWLFHHLKCESVRPDAPVLTGCLTFLFYFFCALCHYPKTVSGHSCAITSKRANNMPFPSCSSIVRDCSRIPIVGHEHRISLTSQNQKSTISLDFWKAYENIYIFSRLKKYRYFQYEPSILNENGADGHSKLTARTGYWYSFNPEKV
jgi:hypothetical protein